MTTWKLEHNDVIEWAKNYRGEPFHALLADPPYHLVSIGARFGKPNSKPPKGGVYKRTSNGFMNSVWDQVDEKGMGIAFDPATWAALAQHLLPGAFGMAFASSRGWHRLACAIEGAGMIIQPSIFNWVTLQSFPKATRIMGGGEIWEGHRYGGQTLKNAVEPIIVFQKPYLGRPVDSIVGSGAGALWIDGGRIPTSDDNRRNSQGGENGLVGSSTFKIRERRADEQIDYNGRWPSNFLLQHSPLCQPDACIDSCPVRLFDEQAGESTSRRSMRGEQADIRGDNYNRSNGARLPDSDSERGYDDSGPASRMFHRATWQYEVAEQLAGAEPARYCAKTSSAEREAGLEGFEAHDKTAQYGDGLNSATKIRTERQRAEGVDRGKVQNNHPTLKPISLTKYLATLLLPPAAYAPRRILIPFSGAGSECAGAILAGWESVTGIESNAAYVAIAEARLRWWSQWPGWGQTDVEAILKAAAKDEPAQLPLFGGLNVRE
jgi:hypothetical protein